MASSKKPEKAPVSREEAVKAAVLRALEGENVKPLGELVWDTGLEMLRRDPKAVKATEGEVVAALRLMVDLGTVILFDEVHRIYGMAKRTPKAEEPVKKPKAPTKPGKAALLAALAKAGKDGLTKKELAKALGCPEEQSDKLALSLLVSGTISGFGIPGRGDGYRYKSPQSPIPKKVEDTTERDKRETMRSSILDRVRDAIGGCNLADLAKAAGVKFMSDGAEWTMFVEVLNTLTASGTIKTRKFADVTVYEMGKPAPKPAKKTSRPSPKAALTGERRQTIEMGILDELALSEEWLHEDVLAGVAHSHLSGWTFHDARVFARSVLDRLAEEGKIRREGPKFAPLVFARDVKPAKVPFVLTPELKKALHKAMLKEIAAWKCWHRCDVVAGAASNALPESWSRDEVQETYMEEINELVEKGKIQEHDHWYAPLGLSTTAPNGPNSPSSKPAKKAKGALTPEARAELAQSADEAIASPEVAEKIRAAQPAKKGEERATTQAPSDVHTLPLSLLRPSPSNPRRRVGDLEALAASLKATGQVSPILVRPHPTETGLFEVVCGHRRSAAAQLAGLGSVLVVIRELSDREVLEAQIAENSQRADVHPLEEADAFNELHKKHGVAVEEIAARLGRPAPFVHSRLRLLKLASGPRAALELGRITLGVALELTRLPEESQEEALPRILVGQGAAPKPLADCKPVLDKLSLRLIDAPFALDDASLPGGACTRCPKRTGAQAALFAEADGPDLCTDRRCYQDKVAVSEGRAPRTAPRSREIAQDPAPIAPSSSVIQPDRPAIENETAPIAQDRAEKSTTAAPSDPARAPAAPVDPSRAILGQRLAKYPLDLEVFLELAGTWLLAHNPRITQDLRAHGSTCPLVATDVEIEDALCEADPAVVWAIWCAAVIGDDTRARAFVERRLACLDRATTPAPAPAAQVDEDDGLPVLGLTTEEAVAKVLLEHGPQTSRQVASALGWDEEDRETQHKATAALAKVATCIDTRWYLPEQIPVRERVLAALKATKVRRNARVLATTLGLVESEVATVLEQLFAERIVTRFSGGEGAGAAYQLVETWKAKRGAPKARGKAKEGKKGKAQTVIPAAAIPPAPGPLSVPATREESLLEHLRFVVEGIEVGDWVSKSELDDRLTNNLDDDQLPVMSDTEFDSTIAAAVTQGWLLEGKDRDNLPCFTQAAGKAAAE